MAAKFEIRSEKAGEYRWVLVSQGRTLAISAPYSRRALVEKAIVSFRLAATGAAVVDTTVPAAKTTAGKVARATGRAVAKAVVTGSQAVGKVEQVAANATKRAVKKTARTAETAADAATGPRRKAAPARKRR